MGYIGLVVLGMVAAAGGEALRARALGIPWQEAQRVSAASSAGYALIAFGLTVLAVALLLFFRAYVSILL